METNYKSLVDIFATTVSVGDPPGGASIPIVNPAGPIPASTNISQTQAANAAMNNTSPAPVGGNDRIKLPDPGATALVWLAVVVSGLALGYGLGFGYVKLR